MDGLLVLMVIAWGANYSLLKRAFQEVPPVAFNTLRMGFSSAVFLAAIWLARRRAERGGAAATSSVFYTSHSVTTRDRWDLLWLGLVGHCVYQLCFVGGLARTTASNAALIFGASPVAVAIITEVLGHERVGRLHWLGAVLSTIGIYFVVTAFAALVAQLGCGSFIVRYGSWRMSQISLVMLALVFLFRFAERRLVRTHLGRS